MAASDWDALSCQLDMQYICKPDGTVNRRAHIQGFPFRQHVLIPIYARDDEASLPGRWSMVSRPLSARAKARFEAQLPRFWQLAPRAAGLVSPFPHEGLVVRLKGRWTWGEGHIEKPEELSLMVETGGRVRNILLRAEGRGASGAGAGVFPLLLGAFSHEHDGPIPAFPANDTAPWRAQRELLAARFGPAAQEVLEHLALPGLPALARS
jgi:hypothetical protein